MAKKPLEGTQRETTHKALETVLTEAKAKKGEVLEVEDRQGKWRLAKLRETDGVAVFAPPVKPGKEQVWVEGIGAIYTGKTRRPATTK